MKMLKLTMSTLLTLSLFGIAPVFAQDEDTIDVVDENATPDDIMHRIELPEMAAEIAVEASAFGRETASEAREQGQSFGQERAQQAQEQGREMGESIAAEAQERGREMGESMANEARESGGRPDGAGPPDSAPRPGGN